MNPEKRAGIERERLKGAPTYYWNLSLSDSDIAGHSEIVRLWEEPLKAILMVLRFMRTFE